MIDQIPLKPLNHQSREPPSSLPAEIWLTKELNDLSAIWPRSNNLHRARCYAFQCADILEVWCRTLGVARQTQPLFIGVMSHLREPLMLLALGLERRDKLVVLTFLDGGVCDYASPILFPACAHWSEKTVRILWNQLEQVLPAYDTAILERMPDHVEELRNPLMSLATSRHPVSCHVISLPSRWEDFAQTRLPRRKDTHRRRRQLGSFGDLTFEIAKTAEQRDVTLDALMEQKSEWYNSKLGHDLFKRPGFDAFFREIARSLSPPGPVQLSALKLNNAIISAHMGFVVGERFHQYLPTYAPQFKRFAPGRLLHEELIRWSITSGLRFFDFGIGDEPYKNEYCDIIEPLYRIIIPRTIKGRSHALSWKLRQQLRKLKKSALGLAPRAFSS
jgi:CelD/BcsL family acetyltransferase involved in cellulose biosynthesis